MVGEWKPEVRLVSITPGAEELIERAYRNFIGFELNQEYCKMAEKRIEPYLMQQTIF